MKRAQHRRHWLAPRIAGLALGLATTVATASAQTTPVPPPQPPPAPSPPSPSPPPQAGKVITDAVNVPVQVRTSVLGMPIVNLQQILHKSSLDEEEPAGDETAVRVLNNLSLDAVGLRVDLHSTSWAKKPGDETPRPTPTPDPNPSSSSTRQGARQTAEADANALVHAGLEGTAEAVVRLGPQSSEIVSVSGRGLASSAAIGGACGSLSALPQVALGATNLRILGREIALPANPEPNTEVPLTDIPGLVDGTLILNEQATFGDGVHSQIVAVAPLRLQLRLSLAGLGGLADVDVSLGGNSAAIDCGTSAPPPTEPPPTEPPPTEPPPTVPPIVPPTTPPTTPPTEPPPTAPPATPPVTPPSI